MCWVFPASRGLFSECQGKCVSVLVRMHSSKAYQGDFQISEACL